MRRALTVALVAALLAASAGTARAELITGSVTWDAMLSTPKVSATSTVAAALAPQPPAVEFADWSSWTFSNQSLPAKAKVTGDLNIFALVKGETAQWHNAPFTLTFVIKDGPNPGSGAAVPGAITFSGELNGTLSKSATGQVTSTLDIDWLGPTTKTLDIDHHLYVLSVSAFAEKGTLPNPDDLGRVTMDVHVRKNPEPATALLAALALPAVAFAWRRRSRRSNGALAA